MSSWLDRLDRRFGRHVPENLTLGLVAIQGLLWFVDRFEPGFSDHLTLDASRIAHGELWRVVTFVFLPPVTSPFWFFFALAWTYSFGGSLEREWGGARYLAYWVIGMLGTAALAVGLGVPGTNEYLLASLLFAVATLDPEREIMMLLVIPVRLKWVALLTLLGLVAQVAALPDARWVFLPVALCNYVAFFGPVFWRALRARRRKAVHVVEAHRQSQGTPVMRQRACATCGVTDADRTVEFRVCTCERCGKPTNFCLAHVREHLAAPAATTVSSDQ